MSKESLVRQRCGGRSLGWLVLASVMLSCLSVLLSGCISISFTGFPKPDRPFSADVFILDESDFPPGSKAEPIAIDSDEDGAGEHLIRSIYLPGGGLAVQKLRGYGSADRAAREFKRTWKSVFGRGPYDSEWVVPEELQDYRSRVADQFKVACGTHGSQEYCRLSAQYEEYYVRLTIAMRPPMTYADVERVLQALDARFAAKLKGEDSTPMP